MARVLGTRVMHIHCCFGHIYIYHITRNQQLHNLKYDKEGIVYYYSLKINSYTSCLHNNLSEVIESRIKRNSRSMPLSNITTISDMSSFRTCSNTTYDSNQIIHKKGYLIFGSDNFFQKSITSNETYLTIAIYDLIIYEGLSFNLAQKPIFKNILELARNVLRDYNPLNIKLVSKYFVGVIHE